MAQKNNFSGAQRAVLAAQLRTLLLNTELSGNTALSQQFSLSNGQSSYSFGIAQIDVRNNPAAVPFLASIGFTPSEITLLQSSSPLGAPLLAPLNAKLAANAKAVDTFTDNFIQTEVNVLNSVINYVSTRNPAAATALLSDRTLQMAVIDYNNQFTINGINSTSPPANSMLAYLSGNAVNMTGGSLQLTGTPTATSIQDYINVTLYGHDNPSSVAGRANRFATAMSQINANQVLAPSTAAQAPIVSFGMGASALDGDVSVSGLDDGTFRATSTSGMVSTLQTYSATTGVCQQTMSYNLATGTLQWRETSTTPDVGAAEVAMSGINTPLYVNGARVTIDTNTTAFIEGSALDVLYTPGCTITVGKNGQNSDNSQLDNISVRVPYAPTIGAYVALLDDSRANVYVSNGTVLGSYNINAGVYGGANHIEGHFPSTNYWVGTNGKFSSTLSPNQVSLSGTLTVVDNSAVNVEANNATVYYGSNISSGILSGYQLQVHLNGNGAYVQDHGTSDVFYNTGSYNTIDAMGNNTTVYNYSPNSRSNNLGSWDRIFNYAGSSNYSYNANSTDTISGGTISGTMLPWYDGYYGFAGKKTAVDESLKADIAPLAALERDHGDSVGADIAQKAHEYVKAAVGQGFNSAVSGSRWDHDVITWSLANSGQDSVGRLNKAEEADAKRAFDAWSAASGLTFVEVDDSKKADITIGWDKFDTANTGVVGFTTTQSKNGSFQAGVAIRLEDKNETPLVPGSNGSNVYAGTDATLSQVLLHEIGHAIGLATNSDPNSIESYYLGSQNTVLSTSDVQTVQALYGTATKGPAALRSPGLDQMIQAMAAFAASHAGAAYATTAANGTSVQSMPELLVAVPH